MSRTQFTRSVSLSTVVSGSTVYTVDAADPVYVYTDAARSNVATCYADSSSSTTVANPLVASGGRVTCWLSGPQTYYLSTGGTLDTFEAMPSIELLPSARSNRLGTSDPNPGGNRFFGMPAVMASPPTLTVNSAPTLANGVLTPATTGSGAAAVPNATAPWNYNGGNMVVAGTTYPDYLAMTSANVSGGSPTTPTPVVGSGCYYIEFETDADAFELFVKATATAIRGMVDQFDGKGWQYFTSQAPAWQATTAYTAGSFPNGYSQVHPVTPNGYIYQCLIAGTSGGSEPAWSTHVDYKITDGTVTWINVGKSAGYHYTPPDGSNKYLTVNFGSKAFRRIRLGMGATNFYGIYMDPKNTMWQSILPDGPKVIAFGDSMAEGTGTNAPDLWFGNMLGLRLGWYNVHQSAAGGTGYQATNPGASPAGLYTFRSRTQSDIISQSPDVVIITGGINDSTPATVQSEATLMFQQIKAALPSCKIVVMGPFSNSGSPSATAIQVRDAIRAACVGNTDLYIESIGGPYPYSGNTADYVDTGLLTGIYNTVTPANATKLTFNYSGGLDSTDPTHYNAPGHDYVGYWLASKIAFAMPL